ncbi:MAG: hypothetical protein K6G68_09915 [Oscillospiraceae bacterium]|nr:hypothetical protein [Oscillospiraceae bacterium]MBQ4487595.1 hypothetical protein [Oscillospiraceae bacterium]MCR5807329.1 hypothetical protein [Oscillospiraceae bacterium]
MEIILVLVIIFLLMWILGVSTYTMLTIAFWIMFGAVIVTWLFFIVMNILLIGAKRVEAIFSRSDKKYWGSFDRVYYMIDGEEYPNMFPGEVAFKDILYKDNKQIKVLFTKGKKVFDKNAELCCRIGIAVMTVMSIVFVHLAMGLYLP